MAPRLKSDRHLSLPTTGESSVGRSRSVSDRSDRSDDSSEFLDSRSQQSGETGPKPARKRASKPKVRTGCISCKKRHVKCDEQKPGCTKCENLGLICEGYTPPRTVRQTSRAERPLRPKPRSASLAPQPCGASLETAETQLPFFISPGFGFHVGDDDVWYFTLFRDQIAYDLSPCRGDNFWHRSSLRDSMTMRFIRHSILSIGAYARALIDLKTDYPLLKSADRPWWPASIYNRHRQAALSHHAKALSYLRQDIGENGIDSRSTMAATLLFIVFENMQGNYHASGNLIRSGIKVLNNLGRAESRNFIWQAYCERFEAPSEIDEMAHMFSRHSITSVLTPFPHGKSAYHMLFDDDDTLLDNDDKLSIEYATRSTTPRTLQHGMVIWETTLPALGRFYAKALWRNLNPHYEVDDDAIQEQAHFLARLHDFGSGVAALQAVERDDAKMRGLLFLSIHHLVATIFVSCCLDRTEVSYDDFSPQFEDIMAKIKLLMEMPLMANKTGFSNEVGSLPLVTFVASKCRVPRLRLEALDIIRDSGWREGPWDGTSLSNAMVNLMQLEGQSGREEEVEFSLPPEARYVWTNMFWDFENRQMTMQYTKVWSNEPGRLGKVTRVVRG
ncbi:hypothetical protein BJ170DRAFT_686387 [Xylariales sp. AK1849]|nr:hypothetical protein BJ170DRAFT_686387 [Xylariales sp. AK1849]